MADNDRLKYLRIALILVGVIFLAGIYPLMIIWPSGWTWHTGHSDYPLMIVGIYATSACSLSWQRATRSNISVSSGSPSGRAWSMLRSWPSNRLKLLRITGTCSATYLP